MDHIEIKYSDIFLTRQTSMMLIATLAQTILHPGHLFPAMLGPQMKSSTKA